MALRMIPDSLKGVFLDEVQALIEKYSNIAEEEQLVIKQAIDILERLNLKGDKLEHILEIARLLTNYSVEVVELCLWCSHKMHCSISISDAEEYAIKLEQQGFVRIEDIVMYEENTDLSMFLEDLIENELLTDSYHIQRLFSHEIIAEMWLDKTSFKDAAEELQANSLEELLDTTVREAYLNYDNRRILYAEIDL